MAKKIGKLWAEVELDESRRISHAGLLMMLALDEVRNAREITPDLCIAVWRRYCASNLTEAEWVRAAWNRQDANTNGMRALRELSEAVHVASYGRINPTQHHLVDKHRGNYAAAMPVPEFITYCKSTYARRGKLD